MSHPLVYPWSDVVKRLSLDSRWQEAIHYLSPTDQLQGVQLQKIWALLDQAWDEVLQKRPSTSDLSTFLYDYYQHPVWLINAAFSESDANTIADRMAAIRLIAHGQPEKILDFGGGIGTVARLCAINLPDAKTIDLVDITEFRSIIREHLADFPMIRILEKADPPYDAIVSTEVLEHLTDPVGAIADINRLLRVGGAFSASWSFYPCIKCHLPKNFHLRRLMPWIIRSLGFGFYGFERRGTTVYGFIKHADVTPRMMQQARWLEHLSRLPLPLDRVLLLLRGL
jgi:SAM-dependent methyltransferase